MDFINCKIYRNCRWNKKGENSGTKEKTQNKLLKKGAAWTINESTWGYFKWRKLPMVDGWMIGIRISVEGLTEISIRVKMEKRIMGEWIITKLLNKCSKSSHKNINAGADLSHWEASLKCGFQVTESVWDSA